MDIYDVISHAPFALIHSQKYDPLLGDSISDIEHLTVGFVNGTFAFPDGCKKCLRGIILSASAI